MNFKKYLAIFSLFIILLCCVSAISAASNDVINNTVSEVDSGDDVLSINDDEQVIGVDDSASVAQGNDDKLSGQSRTINSLSGDVNLELDGVNDDNSNQLLLNTEEDNLAEEEPVYEGQVIKNPDFEEGNVATNFDVEGWEVLTNDSRLQIQQNVDLGWYKVEVAHTGNNALYFPASAKESVRINGTWTDVPATLPAIGQYINFDTINSISFYAKSDSGTFGINVTIDDSLINSFDVTSTWNQYVINTTNITGTHLFKISRAKMDYSEVNGCLDTFQWEYNELTHSNFTYSVKNIENNNIEVQFTNEALGLIKSFLWEFDDGTTSTEINPAHNFTSGSHKIKLTSSSANHNDTYSYDLVLEFPSTNGQIYKTIQEAIDNAADGDVIEVPMDLSENINIDKNLTLNFNGNKLIGSGSAPVIQVTGGAQATIKNITLENSNVLSTDDESSLTITESNIADTNITLSTGNIALDGNEFTGSFITVANANAVIANNNIANGGIKVNGGKSKINNNVLSGNDVAITQTEGETNITSNIITDNNIGVNVTNGTANINFNVIYNNNKVALTYVGSVDASNNWFGVMMPSFSSTPSDEYVDIYAPNTEQPAWLVLTLNCNETTLSSAQNYTISVDLTLNSKGENISTLGTLPNFSLHVSTELGKASAVNVENNIGEFTLTTATLTSDDVIFKINGEDYTLDVNVFKVEDRIKELETQLADAQANATKLAEDLADANQKVENLTTQLNETQANVAKLADDLVDANQKAENLTTQLSEAQANATKLADDLVDANQKAENLTSQLSDAQKQIQTLSADLISTTVAANNLNIKALTNGNIQVTLKANGTALANKTVNVIINGVVYNGTTGEDGVAKIAVKFASAGTYYATVTFAGDDTYKSSISTSKVVVSKKATKITAPKKSFKAKVKTKKVKITLKSGSTVLKSKKITLKVNGKTYTAKTNSKGVATIKVTKLIKKGTFTYTVKFAGDKAYKAITKKGKITIK